jgi:hypothetical protein
MDNTNRLELVISVKDDGSVVIDTIKKKTDDLGQATEQASAKGAGALAVLKKNWLEFTAVGASIYGVVKGLNAFVEEAARAQQIESRMAFQIEAAGIGYEKVKRAIDGYTESIASMTRFSDDAAREGLGRMMQYTTDLTKAQNGVRLAMDMTTQDIADLETNIRYVGMAMSGEIEILSKLNPAFKDLNSKLDEDASKADKAAFAWNNLIRMFGGASLKDLQTHAGQVAQTGKQWAEFKKTLGELVLPTLDTVLERMTQLGKASLLTLGKGTEKEKIGAQIAGWQTEILGLQAEQPFVSEKAQLEIIAKIEAARRKLTEADNEEKRAVEALNEETARAASLKYTLGMKGVAEEAAEFRKDLKTMFQSTEALDNAFKTLGVSSQRSMATTADWALRALTTIEADFKKGKASVVDYVNALKAASDAMKKLTPEDTAKKREEAWDKNAETIKGISKDEEGWLKKVNKANDELFQTLKDLKKLEVPTHADVGPMEREVNAMKEKLRAEGLVIPVTTEGETGGGGGGTSWTDYVKGDTEFFQGGKKAVDDMNDTFQNWSDQWGQGLDVPINFFGIGSSRKPITEKIREIIGEFGGLGKAMSGMEAEINVAELSLEYNKLQNKLNQIEQAYAQTANMMFMHGYSYQRSSADVERQTQVTEELTAQLRILQMKMDYERMKAYGGSYQAGTQYVPQTGLYTLHEGEQVIQRNVRTGDIRIIIQGSSDSKSVADELVRTLKYRLNTELRDLL